MYICTYLSRLANLFFKIFGLLLAHNCTKWPLMYKWSCNGSPLSKIFDFRVQWAIEKSFTKSDSADILKKDPAMFFSVQFSAENWLQKSRKFSKFFIPIFYFFFYVTLLFTYPFPLIWRKFFKCSVLFLFFQLTIHIFLLFFKLLSFRGPILAEIKTLTDFKTE